ncbi:MAG: ABC transporter ATP-binding protein [Trueperaceae bacterium]|nr:ABC transporter ATP-binding protein [Trueperaceae bacterium]
MSAHPLYRVRDLRKSYRVGDVTTTALNGVDLDVTAGEFTAIAGPSGSGKSTLLHLMGVLDRADAGEVWLNGGRIDRLPRRAAARLRLAHLGFVFQAYNLVPVLSALENAAFVLELRGEARATREAKARAALARLDMEGFADRRPNQLSGGQQQRVAIARAIAADPTIVLADEPTANLDSQAGADLIDLMRRLNEEEDVTFVFSTHDPRLLDRVDRIVRLEDGRVVDDGVADGDAPRGTP